MKHNDSNLTLQTIENVLYYPDNRTSTTPGTSWLIIFLDRSQLIMTIVGVIANVGTSITLIKNGQVSGTLTLIKKWPGRWHFNLNMTLSTADGDRVDQMKREQ